MGSILSKISDDFNQAIEQLEQQRVQAGGNQQELARIAMAKRELEIKYFQGPLVTSPTYMFR